MDGSDGPDHELADRASVALRTLLAVLRSPAISDAHARREAEHLAAQALVSWQYSTPSDHSLETAPQAFQTLRDQLRFLTQPGDVNISFVPPPSSGRAVPHRVAESARSCVRAALMAQIDSQHARRARVQWDCDGSNLLVDIHDDGVGTTRREDDLYRPIAQKVEEVHGQWSFSATQGWGAYLHMRFPLDLIPRHLKDPIDQLPARQQQIHRLIAAGRTNAEIAQELGISVHTVKYHIGRMMRQQQVTRRPQLVAGYPPNSPGN